MDEQAARGDGLGSTVLRNLTITSALSVPHRTIFFGDCAEPRSDETTSTSDGHTYSKSIMVLDLIWNLAFVAVSAVVLFSATGERPSTPLRIWVSGYSMQCLLHVGFVYFQYQKRRRVDRDHFDDEGLSSSQTQSSIMKQLESINTVISSIWWVIGFYWIVVGGQALLQDSPRLYWLTVVFLAFDVFFMIFCIGMACIIFFVLFCCIPILAIAYAVAMRKGVCEGDISSLSKYRYCQDSQLRVLDGDKKRELLGERLGSTSADLADELSLLPEDSDCCICLSRYVDGVELYTLPCRHHFHCGCISKWLRINATCPLCKFNIRRSDTFV